MLSWAAVKKKPSISFVGCGNLVLALAPQLRRAGYRIDEIAVRASSRRRALALARRVDARVVGLDDAALDAKVLATRRDSWKGTTVLHSSGALTSAALVPMAVRGAAVASLHPMMTFVRRSAPPLKGVGFAAEGARSVLRLTRALVGDLGGHWFTVAPAAKPLYHAWGAFASPLLIMELAQAEAVARAAGISDRQARRIMEPIVRRTIDNYFAHGAAAAFSGPLARGDVATVTRHLAELRRLPAARDVSRALARGALAALPVGRRPEMAKTLGK